MTPEEFHFLHPGTPPHQLCKECGHFACTHADYPGRHSKSPTCSYRSAQLVHLPGGRVETVYDPCQCTRTAMQINA